MEILIETKELSKAIIDIIQSANERLFLVTPYLQFKTQEGKEWHELIDALKGVQSRGVEIQVILRKNQQGDPLKVLEILRSDRLMKTLINDLHAKIYCNEKQALITSMNLYAHSYISNYEIGILINRDDDENFGKIFTYIEKLKRKGLIPPDVEKFDENDIEKRGDEEEQSKKIFDWIKKELESGEDFISVFEILDEFPSITKMKSISVMIETAGKNKHLKYWPDDEVLEYFEIIGHCIICKETIRYDNKMYKVRCNRCYEKRIRTGKYCHECGEDYNSYPNNPLCITCKEKFEKERKNKGFCIKCGKKMDFDIYKIYVRCRECWDKKKRGKVEGDYCHSCGTKVKTSTDEAFCPKCISS